MTAKGRLVRNILIATLALVLLGGGYYFAVRWEPQTEVENIGESANTVFVVSEKLNDIESIHIKNEQTEYDIIRNEKDGDVEYSIPELDGVAVNTYDMISAFGGLVSLAATREVTADSISEFGLDGSVCYTLKKTDGTEITVIMGDEVPTGGEFYCKREDDNRVYTVSSYGMEYVKSIPEDYRVTVITDVSNIKAITDFAVYNNETPIMKVRTATESERAESIQVGAWMCEYPWKEIVSDNKLAELFGVFANINATGFADIATGFDYRIEFSAGNASYNISIGDTTDDGVYLRDENSGAVYVVDKSIGTAVQNINPNDYISKLVWLVDISKVAKVRIASADGEYVMEPGSEDKPYIINGREVPEDDFKKKYQIIIGATLREREDVTVGGETYMTITYEYLDGHCEVVKFYEHNERDVVAVRPDGATVLLIRSEVDRILGLL